MKYSEKNKLRKKWKIENQKYFGNRRFCKGSRKVKNINRDRIKKGLPLLNEKYVGETVVKNYVKKRFIKYNPLYNKRFNGLELDVYVPYLKLAFEYNGIQHYKFIPYFHKTKDNFKKRLERDKRKKVYCKENNISLIVIPYYIEDIDTYIDKKIAKLPYKIL